MESGITEAAELEPRNPLTRSVLRTWKMSFMLSRLDAMKRVPKFIDEVALQSGRQVASPGA
jgi:hypothetical protein